MAVLVSSRNRLLIPVSIAAAALLAGAPGAGAGVPAAETVRVNARVVLGFTNDSAVDVEATGLVEGKPFRRGAMELRSRFDGGNANGRFTLFDGRGGLRGRASTSTSDGIHFTGTFTAEGGSGRYAGATGTLRFGGALDSDRVPAVTVLPGTLEGRLRVRPAPPRPARTKPLAIAFRGKSAKVHFHQDSAHPIPAKLTSAVATAMDRFGNGVLLKTQDIDLGTPLRPTVMTWYGADGTWTARGTLDLDSGTTGSDPLKVTGGTGRYRGARGTLAHTLFGSVGFSGVSGSRLRGKLRFP